MGYAPPPPDPDLIYQMGKPYRVPPSWAYGQELRDPYTWRSSYMRYPRLWAESHFGALNHILLGLMAILALVGIFGR